MLSYLDVVWARGRCEIACKDFFTNSTSSEVCVRGREKNSALAPIHDEILRNRFSVLPQRLSVLQGDSFLARRRKSLRPAVFIVAFSKAALSQFT